MLLQHGADPNIRNTDGKSALDLADPSAKAVLTGQSLYSAADFTVNTYSDCENSCFSRSLDLAERLAKFRKMDSSRYLAEIQNIEHFDL